MSHELHISSCIIQARPAAQEVVQQRIAAIPGAEVRAMAVTGKIVVTLESDSEDTILRQLDAMRALPGVLSAFLVFHHVDPLNPDEEHMPCR